ncbi:DUF2784 family protein [Candidatus Jorgensenbacteria bacterium]|nr:DUF2784 family protein [Candidatus Jorgensenbacteria bacterium]
MIYRLLARSAFLLHWVLLLWIFVGAIVGLFHPGYVPVHILFLGLTLLHQWACKWQCSLTIFEKAMLSKCAPDEVYEGAFVRHYMKKYFRVEIPPKRIVYALVAVFAWTLILWGINSLLGR